MAVSFMPAEAPRGRLLNRSPALARARAEHEARAVQRSRIDDWSVACSAPPEQVDQFDSALTDLVDAVAVGNHAIWGDPLPPHLPGGAVQLRARLGLGEAEDVAETAARGLSGPPSALPHAERIQASFGRHDVGDVEAHVGPEARLASAELGAFGYASGGAVAFAETPDLFTAAHEAAHVVQQRAGLSPAGGVGVAGDRFERHADRVAAHVVRGESAEAALDELVGRGCGAPLSAVQLSEDDKKDDDKKKKKKKKKDRKKVRAPKPPPPLIEVDVGRWYLVERDAELAEEPAPSAEEPAEAHEGAPAPEAAATEPKKAEPKKKKTKLSKGARVRIEAVVGELAQVTIVPKDGRTAPPSAWLRRVHLVPVLTSEDRLARHVAEGGTKLAGTWVRVTSDATPYAEEPPATPGPAGLTPADALRALERRFKRGGKRVVGETKALVTDEVIAKDEDKCFVELDLEPPVWIKRSHVEPLANAAEIVFVDKRVRVASDPDGKPDDIGKEGKVVRQDLQGGRVLVAFDGEAEPRWVLTDHVIVMRGLVAPGEPFAQAFSAFFAPIVPQLEADHGPLDAAALDRLLTAEQRALMTGYFNDHVIPDRLFTGSSNQGGFSGPARVLMSAYIFERGRFRVHAADGTPMRLRKVVGNNCGEWVRLVNHYAGVSEMSDARHGVVGQFDHAGNVVLGGGAEHEGEFKGDKIARDALPDDEVPAREGIVVSLVGVSFTVLEEREGAGPLSDRQLQGEEEAREEGRMKTASRLGQLPFSRYDEIQPGDWIWYYNGNASSIGSHSVIFEQWTGMESEPDAEVRWREAMVHSQPKPEEPGGRRHPVLLGDRYAKVDGKTIVPVNKFDGPTAESGPATTVEALLVFDRAKAAKANKALLRTPSIKRADGTKARIDEARVRAVLQAENAALCAGLGERLGQAQRALITEANASADLGEIVALNQLLVPLAANAARVAAGKHSGGVGAKPNGKLELLLRDWSAYPREDPGQAELCGERLEIDEAAAAAKNEELLDERRARPRPERGKAKVDRERVMDRLTRENETLLAGLEGKLEPDVIAALRPALGGSLERAVAAQQLMTALTADPVRGHVHARVSGRLKHLRWKWRELLRAP